MYNINIRSQLLHYTVHHLQLLHNDSISSCVNYSYEWGENNIADR
jgi:hypothetical protein